MSADAPILCNKIRLDEECMIPHLSELNQNDIENCPRHVTASAGTDGSMLIPVKL